MEEEPDREFGTLEYGLARKLIALAVNLSHMILACYLRLSLYPARKMAL